MTERKASAPKRIKEESYDELAALTDHEMSISEHHLSIDKRKLSPEH
jgi:hypothetical protein